MADQPSFAAEAWKGLNLRFARQQAVKRPGAVLGMDVDSGSLRVAQCVPRGNRIVVSRVEVAPLPLASDADAEDPAVIGRAVADALDTLRMKSLPVVMGVPRHLVILRTLVLPPSDDIRELASIVHLQIGKDLPFRYDEAVIDFKVRGPLRDATQADKTDPPAANGKDPAPPKVEVLVAAIRRETADYYHKIAAAAKVKLVALGWLSQANARAVEARETDGTDETVALITLRAGEVGVDVLAGGALVFSRGGSIRPEAPAAPDAVTATEAREDTAVPTGLDAATYVELATIEVVRSLHSYGGMEMQAAVKQLLIAGATGREQEVRASLTEKLQIPSSLLDLGELLDLPKGAGEQGADAVGAIGLGLGVNDPEGLSFDFLHPKRPAVQRNVRRTWTLGLCAGAVALLMAVLGVRSHLVNKRMKVYRSVQAELTAAEKKVPSYRRMQVQAATVQNWTREGRSWLEHLAYLSAVLPGSEDLYITSLSVSGQGNIHLAVQARSGDVLANLDRQLRAAGYQVKPLAITPGTEKFGYNFRSTVELIIPPKLKIELSKVQPPARPADDASLESKSRPGRKGGRS